MAVSMRDLDPAFQGAGQKAGLEIWRIENFNPVPVPKSSYGKFFTGDSYVILKTTASKSGALRHDIHYWIGKDTSQDEAGAAAIKTVELDAALGGRAVQYREVQGHETEKFLSYFKPCIIPQEGGVASGFKHAEAEKHKTRLFVCRGKHVVHVKEVPFARSSLNHDDIFVLDTESKIFQFNGSNSSIQERAKALEVVQYIKDTYHEGKCEIAAIEDGKLMADPETGEFWGFFGGFAPLPRKAASDNDKSADSHSTKLLSVEKGQAEPVEADSLKREFLDTNKCYILDCGLEIFVWMGRNTSLDERKSASGVADELVSGIDQLKPQIVRVIEGFETVLFKSKFDSWPQTPDVTVSEDGRGKVAALLKRQGVNVKGLLKADAVKEEPQPYIDCTGHLQVWRVNGQEKILLPASDQSKFYSGDCFIFQYSYPGEDKDDCLIGTWIGKNSVEEERASANSLASKMVESMKFLASQARIYEGNEPIQFHSILQTFIVFKGGLSDGYKTYIAEKEIPDETYNEDSVALFRIQGTGPDNMQAIQVEPVASSLNSSYCYILHNGPAIFTWSGSNTTAEDQELIERMLDLIKPNLQSKPQREGTESEQFWDLLGGKSEYPSQKISREAESDPHLFCCSFSNGNLKVTEIYNFSQDDLMTEDIFILDCYSDIFVWASGRLEVQTLCNPEKEQFRKVLESCKPNFVYFQGEQLLDEEVGSLVWQGGEFSNPEEISELFDTTLPTAVYLEIPNGESFAEALHLKGIPYVVFWKNAFSQYAACHFRQALFSVVQSSSTHTWDAFHLARASFELYCVQNNQVLPTDSNDADSDMGPHLLGECLKINVDPPEMDEEDDDEESSSGSLPSIQIHDDEVNLRFLICGAPSTVDESLLRSLEDGLRALLTIEMRSCKLHGKYSAPPPPLQAASFSRGVVTMRCDISTCSSAHISLLVSGSPQACFNDQLLENHIKNEIIEKSQIVHARLNGEANTQIISEPRRSASIACGATIFEVSMKLPQWALQILRQLAPDVSYRSLVALGIASIQGLPVASFEKDDAERLLFFYQSSAKDGCDNGNIVFSRPPVWLKPPPPTRKRCESSQGASPDIHNDEEEKDRKMVNGISTPLTPARQRLKVSAMRPIPHVRRHRMTPFSGPSGVNGFGGPHVEAYVPLVPVKRSSIGSSSATQRKSFSSSSQPKQVISLNPLPLKKHGCSRGSVQTCSEEEFIKDVMEFLILRGHSRLIPQGGLAEFPDAILNGKRLDLYNLYKEVVTRGGFHVGNGINWKGQIFSKMGNYTSTNRMTGVGNTLKRHYETYLLEYELAHDDVDGECCLLCHSSAAGDWVNCGICGEWAHFGCDRRQGLGAFKDYAKTDGLEYICPHCSVTNFKKKQSVANGYSQRSMSSRLL